ncbi:hypothetical protein NP493_8654g00002, partial [Ridgeia piscesae]
MTTGGAVLQQEIIQAEAAQFLGYLNLAKSIPALFATLFICTLSDVFGRKMGLFLPSIGGLAHPVLRRYWKRENPLIGASDGCSGPNTCSGACLFGLRADRRRALRSGSGLFRRHGPANAGGLKSRP